MLEPQPDERGHDDDAHDLEEQIAQRHLPRLHVGAHGRGHRQQAAAQVGAHHQPQRHIHRDTARACQRGREQHGGQAGSASTASTAPVKISSSKSLVSAPGRVRTVGDWVSTVVDSVMSRRASSIKPRPISTGPRGPRRCPCAK